MNIPTHTVESAGIAATAKIISACFILLAGGCAINQAAPDEADLQLSTITVAEARRVETLELSNEQQQSAEQSTKVNVRWGGTITRIQNTADQLTEVEIVARPLKRNGRPVHNDRSDGRFIARVKEFLDPQIVTAGRDITVIGTLESRREGQVGDASYVFPIVDVFEFTYWKKQSPQPQRHFRHWNDRARWYDDPFWPHWILFHPHRHTR